MRKHEGEDHPKHLVVRVQPEGRAQEDPVEDEDEHGAHPGQQAAGEGGEGDADVVRHDHR